MVVNMKTNKINLAFISIKNKLLITFFAIAVFPNIASAILIDVNGSADKSSTNGSSSGYIPLGTTINTSLSFDVGVGDYESASLSNASGTFSWVDDIYGNQLFTIDSVSRSSAYYLGFLRYSFFGTGPALGGFTSNQFIVEFDIGVNPFNSSEELLNLLLNSSVSSIGFGAKRGTSTSFGYARDNAQGEVSLTSVPEPSSIALLGLGLACLACKRRKKTT